MPSSLAILSRALCACSLSGLLLWSQAAQAQTTTHPPTGTSGSASLSQDTTLTFSPASFGFADPSDAPANAFTRVKFTTVPAAGVLTADGVPVNAGDFVPVRALEAAGATWSIHEGNRNWTALASSLDGTKLAAVASSGQIFTSGDSGGTWIPRETNRAWSCIASSADGTHLVATAVSAQVYTSADSGVTWIPRDSSRLWACVASSADGATLTAFADKCYTSKDSGVTWTPRTLAINSIKAVAMSANGVRQVAVDGNNGYLYISTDSGTTWSPRSINGVWTSVASSVDGARLVACATGGKLYTSADFGATWTAHESQRVWRGVASSADGTRLAAVDNASSVYTSIDAGVTWILRNATYQGWCVASSADGTKLVAGGNPGQILTSATLTPVLAFTPAPQATGQPYAGFTFQVEDDGTAAANLDPTPRDFALNVTPAPPSHPPSGTDGSATINEDTTYTFTKASYGFTDLADTPANTFTRVKLTTLPAAGTLTLNGAPVSEGDEVSVLPVNVGGTTYTPRQNSQAWYAVASSADGTKLGAVVAGGYIYTSTDSGATWTARESVRAWRGIASSADGTKLVAVGDYLSIYTSTDSGVTWAARFSTATPRFTSVASSADGTRLVAVTYLGPIYTSSDAGLSWTPRDATRAWLAVASSADGTKLVAAELGGLLYTSTNSGVTWTPRESARAWASLASSANGANLLAADGAGLLYTSSDAGVSWTPRADSRSWTGVASSADGTRLAATAANSSLYTSVDSGLTWTPRESSRPWKAVALSADAAKVVAVNNGGLIYTSVSPIPALVFTPAPNANDQAYASMTFQVEDDGTADANRAVAPRTFTFNVTPVNDAPVLTLTATALAYTENDPATPIDPALTVSDVDNTTLTGATVRISGFTLNQDVLAFTPQSGIAGTFDTNALTLSGTATVADYQNALRSVTYVNRSDNPTEFTGSRTITFSVTDGLLTGSATRTIVITPVNDPPTAPDQVLVRSTGDASTVTLNFPATDPDRDAVKIIGAQSGENVTVDRFTGTTVSFTPAANAAGTGYFTYTVSDGHGLTATGTVAVFIFDNDAPVIDPLPAEIPVVFAASAPLSMPDLTANVHATDNVGVASLTQEPAAGSSLAAGRTTVTFTATDAAGHRTTAQTVLVASSAANRAPVLTAPAAPLTTQEEAPVSFTVAASDPDGDAVALAFSGEAKGAITGGAGRYVYTPQAGASGSDQFTITADDGHQGITIATVDVSIAPLASGLAGRYALLLRDGAAPRAALTLALSAGNQLTGVLRRADGARLRLRPTTLLPGHSARVILADGASLALSFDGKGRVNATLTMTTGTLNGLGLISPALAPAALAGAYTAALDLGTGGFGWCTITVSPRGDLRLAGELPDGSKIGGLQGMPLDRENNAPFFLLGNRGSHPLLAGSALFASTPAADLTGALTFQAATEAQPCTLTGSRWVAAASALPAGAYPITFHGAGVDLAASLRFDDRNRVTAAAPIVAFVSGAGPGRRASGTFGVTFHQAGSDRKPAGPAYGGHGVFLQKLGQAFGQFAKDGQTGSVFVSSGSPSAR